LNLLTHVFPTALDLLFIVVCLGLLVVSLWVIPRNMEHTCTLHDVLWRVLGLVLAGLTIMSVIMLLQRTMEMSGLPWSGVFSAVSQTLFKTHYGITWWGRVFAIAVLWAGWWWGRREHKRLNGTGMFLAAVCVVWSVSASGHASDWGDFTLPEMMSWLHIIGASIWAGSILVFVCVIWPPLRGRTNHELFATCTAKLSRLAGVTVGFVLCTGAYNVWLQLGHVDDLWTSGYGRIILFKITLVGAMIVLGAVNRYASLPKLKQGAPYVHLFVRRLMLEAGLVLGVLICAALLEHGMPPKKQVDVIYHGMLPDSAVRVISRSESERQLA